MFFSLVSTQKNLPMFSNQAIFLVESHCVVYPLTIHYSLMFDIELISGSGHLCC